MERHWTRPHSEASASRCEVRFPASSPYALACGGTAHAAAGRATVGNVIPDYNLGYTYQKTDPRTLTFLELPEVFQMAY
jgi:subtilase family serine protease